MLSNFFKGIVIGIGGIAPGLSGSVLLVIFGLYQKTLGAINAIVKDFIGILLALFRKNHRDGLAAAWQRFKKNFLFLLPLFIGLGLGVVLFGKIVDSLLHHYEMYTRYAFFGLILGTVPVFYREATKEGWGVRYWIIAAIAALAGIFIFYMNASLFPTLTDANFLQSMVMGFAYAGSALVPGVDSAAIMSSLGLYELWLSATANLNLAILIPAAIGLLIGFLTISFAVDTLIAKFYRGTFAVIFGLFLTVIPKVLNASCIPALNAQTLISAIIFLLGVIFSLFFGKLEELKEKES